MAYPLLNKLYYQNQSCYVRTYQDWYQSEDAVKLDFTIGEHQAFFIQTRELWRMGFQILKLNGQVAVLSAALPPIARRQYSRKCLIDEIVLTTASRAIKADGRRLTTRWTPWKGNRSNGGHASALSVW